MLELTFGRPGNDQQIAAIQELASDGLIFSADKIPLALGASKEGAEEVLRSLVDSGYLSIIHIGRKMYYARSIPIDSNIILDTEGIEPELIHMSSEATNLQSTADKMSAWIEQKEAELDNLDSLTEKWRDTTLEVFQEIRNKWSQPLSLEQLSIQAGFNPDDLGLDFEEIDITNHTQEEDSDE